MHLTEAVRAIARSRRILVVKLRTGRAKDLDLCRAVLDRNLIAPAALRTRLDATPMAESEINAVYERLTQVGG